MSLNSHQDYADWVITGRRFYLFAPDWEQKGTEVEEVISVDGVLCICEQCEKTKAGLKMTCDTPSYHHSNFSICLECYKKTYKTKECFMLSSKQFEKYNANVKVQDD